MRSKDLAEKETDKLLEKLERKIVRIYSEASEGVKDKFEKSTERFQVKDKLMREKVKAGLMEEKDYLSWRQGQLFVQERWNQLYKELTEDLVNADQLAASVMNGYMPEAYAMNFNYETYDIEQNTQINTSFTLYSREAVEKLEREKKIILPKRKVDVPKDERWNMKHIQNEITQGILQGKSIPEISKGLRNVAVMDRKAAIRNARTMMTGAQNSGRMDAYARADGLGIKIEKEWMATLDTRTRDSHQRLDGERVPWKKVFSNGLMYPGDPSGDPAEVYNCRCTMVPFYPEYADIIEKRMTYSEWLKSKEEKQKPTVFDIGKAPKRPKQFNFESYEDYEKAREEYKAEREEYNKRLDKFVKESMPERTMTVKQMQDWCDKNNVYLYGDISGVDGRALTALTERLESLFKEFPLVQEWRKEHGYEGKFNIGFEKDDSFLAEASTGFTFGKMFENLEYVLRSEVGLNYDSGYRTVGDGTINQIFDHEFGHNVYNALKDSFNEYDPRYDHVLTNESMGKRVAFEDEVKKMLSGKNGISEYGTTNDDELFAEAFAAWHGGEKTDFANAMGDLLKKYGVIK